MTDVSIHGVRLGGDGPTRRRQRSYSRSIVSRPKPPLSKLGPEDRTLSRDWVEMPNFHDAKSLHRWWVGQQKRRQSELAAGAPGIDVIEPPFPLDVLTILALENPDFFAVVDQLATDVAGLGWKIVDRKEVPQAEAEVVEATADSQRVEAELFLKEAPRDKKYRPMTLTQLFRAVVVDKRTTGNGYVEVATSKEGTPAARPDGGVDVAYDAVRPEGLYHVPARNVRRLTNGGWAQVDDMGKKIAVFRDWGSDPNAEGSIVTREEAAAYKNANEGELKNELKSFWNYHSADAHYGIPAVIAALRSVFGAIYAENRNLRFFINRGLPDWVIEIKADSDDLMEDSEVRTIIDDIVDNLNVHMKYLLEGEDHRALLNEVPRDRLEITWSKLGEPVKDQDFPTYRIDCRDTTIRVYRMPPARLGIIETANLGTGSGQNQAETYKSSIVDPDQRELAEFLTEVLERRGLRLVEFKWNEMDVTDELRQAQILQIISPFISLDEGRAFIANFLPWMELKPYADEDELADVPLKLLELQTGTAAPAGLGAFGLSAPPGEGGALPGGFAMRRFRSDPTYRNIHRRLEELEGALARGHGTAA